MDKVNQITSFWFSTLADDQLINNRSPIVKRWFTKDPSFDEEIRHKFESDIEKAKRGEYRGLENDSKGRLALIILFDQFTRNIYRNTPKAFETDPLALDLAKRSIQDNFDQKLMIIERVFLYMPLMHAEDLKVQDMSVEYFEKQVEASKIKSPQNTPYYQYNLDYARRHRDVIARFGRFPHRNKILGRDSIKEEKDFLGKSGSSF